MSLRGNTHVWLGGTKTRSPRIGTVLHWQLPDVHIFSTHPPLIETTLKHRFSVSQNQNGFAVAGYQKGKYTTAQPYFMSAFLNP